MWRDQKGPLLSQTVSTSWVCLWSERKELAERDGGVGETHSKDGAMGEVTKKMKVDFGEDFMQEHPG